MCKNYLIIKTSKTIKGISKLLKTIDHIQTRLQTISNIKNNHRIDLNML